MVLCICLDYFLRTDGYCRFWIDPLLACSTNKISSVFVLHLLPFWNFIFISLLIFVYCSNPFTRFSKNTFNLLWLDLNFRIFIFEECYLDWCLYLKNQTSTLKSVMYMVIYKKQKCLYLLLLRHWKRSGTDCTC